MSVINSKDVLETRKQMLCKKYNVEDFYYDDFASMRQKADKHLVAIYGRRALEHTSPVVRWKIDGQWYAGAVPVVLNEIEHSHWLLGSWTTLETNTFAMEHELIHMIEESRKNGKVGQTLSRDGEVSIDLV